MEVASIEAIECDGVAEIRSLISEFLKSVKGTPAVREYISSVSGDDSKLLIYLKGRKYRPNHAWETLRRYAEVRFNEYPESFPETVPEVFTPLVKNGVFGLLKTRDPLGRRILYFNGAQWDPSVIGLDQMPTASTHFVERALSDKDAINNDVIFIQNCSGMGMKHFKAYSLRGILKQINIFYYSFPMKVNACYYLNVSSYALYIHKLVKPFLSKELKERARIIYTILLKFNVNFKQWFVIQLIYFIFVVNQRKVNV